MSQNYYNVVHKISIGRLNHIAYLANILNNLLKDEEKRLKEELSDLQENDLLNQENLMKKAAEEGYESQRELQKLKKEDPERYNKMFAQSSLRNAEVMYSKRYNRSKSIFPNLSWNSLSVMSVSQLEFNITLISDLLREELGKNKKLENRSSKSFLDLSKDYFNDVIGLDFNWGNSNEWRKICGHYRVRNAIAHNSGIVKLSNNPPKLRTFSKEYDNEVISIKNGWLDLSREYVIEVVQDSQSWLKDIFKAIEEQFPKIKEK